MKQYRFYTLMVALLLVSFSAFAGNVDTQRAKALGKKFVEANFKHNTQLEWVYTTLTSKGRPSCYVFNVASGGFIIVSACDLTSPVLGYSETGSFNTENIPDGLAYFLDGYGQSVDFAEENLQIADFEIAREWENLERFGQTQTVKTAVVPPLITTHWDQGCYYNACCPKDDDGPCGYTYAGCVATSMAQVLKYWNYPEHGTGTHTYNCPPYGDLYANFGATTYHWDEMPESLNDDDLNVATAMYHCGVSVNMFYGSYGSGALHQSIPAALSSYFGYCTSHSILRDNYTYKQWVTLIHEALDLATPILYGASADGGSAHAFVLDGYDANGLIHINWCWGGELDGYFSIDNFYTYNTHWTLAQKMVADARPLDIFNNMPKAPTALVVEPLSDVSYACTVRWNNPTKNLNESNLTHIDQIVVKRDGNVIYTENDVTPGAAMEIIDEVPFYGLHDYQVYAVNNNIQGLMATQSEVRFGPSCTWTIECGTSNSNGWEGAEVQVLNNAMQVMASATTTSASATVSVEVPLGNVALAWVKGNSTVNNVAFSIKDTENQLVYSYSGPMADLGEGVFRRTNNTCGQSEACDAPVDLYAEVEDNQNVSLVWSHWGPSTEDADYNVYRDGILVSTVRGHIAEYIDEAPSDGGHCYYVTAFCASGESEPTNEACVTIGEGCQPATNLWFEMTDNNKVKLTWARPEHSDGLTQYVIYRTKESDMDWREIMTVSPSSTSSIDYGTLEDETFYLYKLVAFYYDADCYSAPARSKYNEFEYFVRVYWSVDGMAETEAGRVEVYPNPASETLRVEGLEATEIQVYNALGQLVKETHGSNEVNVNGLPEGLYLLRITDTEGIKHVARVAVKE